MATTMQGNPPELTSGPQAAYRTLGAEAAEYFRPIEKARPYPEGFYLLEEGHSSAGVFLLLSGRVKLGVRTRRGTELPLEVAGAGELLGLSACVSGRPYELTARTVTACEAIFIPRESFLQFLRERPHACMEMVRLLSNDLDAAYERIRHLRRH